MKKEFSEGNREFLNKKGFHGDASMSWTMSICEKGYFEGCVHIRDCDNQVHLELDIHTEEWYENSVEKIDKMIKLLQEVRLALPRAKKVQREAKAKHDAKY